MIFDLLLFSIIVFVIIIDIIVVVVLVVVVVIVVVVVVLIIIIIIIYLFVIWYLLFVKKNPRNWELKTSFFFLNIQLRLECAYPFSKVINIEEVSPPTAGLEEISLYFLNSLALLISLVL